MADRVKTKATLKKKGKNTYCPCCLGKAAFVKIVKLPRFMFGEEAKVCRCSVCGVGKTVPVPRMGAEFYEENERYSDLFTLRAELYKEFAKNLLTMLDGIVEARGKRLLDIASGSGFVVEVAGKMGFMAEGIESNASMVKLSRERGLKIIQGDIMKVAAKKGRVYDVIVLSSILEHLESPERMLELCRKKLLKSGGLILLSQAVYDGLLPRAFPWGWYGWQPREHFWHFTPASIRRLSDNMGLKIVKTRRLSLYHPWFLSGGLKTMAGRNLAAVLSRAGNALGMGDSVYVVLSD